LSSTFSANRILTTNDSPFHFNLSREAAEANFAILESSDFNLDSIIRAHHPSPLSYGSEFRPVAQLQRIFGLHPSWNRMQARLDSGSNWPLEPLPFEQRRSDLRDALAFGNHKGATEQPSLLRQLVEEDVCSGYGLPLPLHEIHRIPGALMAPMNVIRQNTIDETGRIVEKDRLTHDQSYRWNSGSSVNSRVRKEDLPPCLFGGVIRRIINWAVAARAKFPSLPILAGKFDFRHAFRRLHLAPETAVQSFTQLPDEQVAVMMLRLTFGGAPCPAEWGVMSEAICDLAGTLLRDRAWDPGKVAPPDFDEVPPPAFCCSSIPFAPAKDLIVDVPVDPSGFVDVYIDDMIALCVETAGSGNATRLPAAVLMAIHAASRPLAPHEPLPRDPMVMKRKLAAEAGPAECKVILGWAFDFRRMTVALPKNKFLTWTEGLEHMLASGRTSAKNLESTIGRLTHMSMVIPNVHHFLSRLRDLLWRAKRRHWIPLSPACADDIRLMKVFLAQAWKGVSLNLLAYRKPTHVYYSDSCPFGLGGYSTAGHAWRFQIPSDLRFRASNNLLEHIAAIITPWIDIIRTDIQAGDCCLSMTDSSTSEGWARKTNFSELTDDPIQATVRLEVARSHATRMIENGIKDYSQWFPGNENIVADSLSRDDDLSDSALTNLLLSLNLPQVPQKFHIVPLPNDISSWLTSTLQRLPVKEQLREEHKRTNLGRGNDGETGRNLSGSTATPSSAASLQPTSTSYLEHSPWLCEMDASLATFSIPWLKAQSAIPFPMWHRPSGTTANGIPPKMKMAKLADFYSAFSEASKTMIPTRDNKKRSPSVSSANSPNASSRSTRPLSNNWQSEPSSSHVDHASTSSCRLPTPAGQLH